MHHVVYAGLVLENIFFTNFCQKFSLINQCIITHIFLEQPLSHFQALT